MSFRAVHRKFNGYKRAPMAESLYSPIDCHNLNFTAFGPIRIFFPLKIRFNINVIDNQDIISIRVTVAPHIFNFLLILICLSVIQKSIKWLCCSIEVEQISMEVLATIDCILNVQFISYYRTNNMGIVIEFIYRNDLPHDSSKVILVIVLQSTIDSIIYAVIQVFIFHEMPLLLMRVPDPSLCQVLP